nr:MAG TPA: hypothetical protein [Caudoviricetes sp.]
MDLQDFLVVNNTLAGVERRSCGTNSHNER